MIRIRSLLVEEFRGIRSLALELNEENYAICGPNGSGKSGVVDAIEFCLRGDVSRLTGPGSSGLSIRSHAPHVDQHDHPEKAAVTVEAVIVETGKAVRIRRTVQNPRQPQLEPDDDDAARLLAELESHPEFALSRRDIVKYIITPPGQRSQDVQTLLRLEQLERMRKAFTTTAHKAKSAATAAKSQAASAELELARLAGFRTFEVSGLLEWLNTHRQDLGLAPLSEIANDTNLKQGLDARAGPAIEPPIKKAAAMADVGCLVAEMDASEPEDLHGSRTRARASVEHLADDVAALQRMQKRALINMGIELLTEDACPLCGAEWESGLLRELLHEQLQAADATSGALVELDAEVRAVLSALEGRIQALNGVIAFGAALDPAVDCDCVLRLRESLGQTRATLAGFIENHMNPESAREALSSWWKPSVEQREDILACYHAIESLADSSSQDAARDNVVLAQERFEKYRSAVDSSEAAEERSMTATAVLGHFNASCTSVLEGIYRSVAGSLARYYCVLNGEDEGNFKCKLEAAPARLNIDVDFYGRGYFPPGAYHSEGHQDGMGLCLYLALAKHTLGDHFTFAVLDDVLMSVDTAHRREVCRLLKSEFPKTQFILTTHDRVWLQYMKTEGLTKRSQIFGGWTVDAGPRIWDDRDVWTDIEHHLNRGEVAEAAGLLRRYLEYAAAILADNLHAPVKFRGDGRYDLGDLLPPALTAFKKRLTDAENAARSWGRSDQERAIAARRSDTATLIAATNAELWAINPSVHFTAWANLTPREFSAVVAAFREVLSSLRCDNPSCASYLYVLPQKGDPEELRCSCGATTLSLRRH